MRNIIMLAVFPLLKGAKTLSRSTLLAVIGGSVGLLVVLGQTNAIATLNYFQGFEEDTGDWMVSQGITRVSSDGGTLGLPSSSGSYHAEIQNLHDGYSDDFGDAGYSRYGGSDSVYNGDFYQSIDVYIYADWALPTSPSEKAFWIDMTPYHADPANYGAEHNFRIKALGSSAEVYVDGQTDPIAELTTSGWYTFEMTWEKAEDPTDPVITNMYVYDSSQNLEGTTTVYATSPGGPFYSSDLRGNGYVWITLWQNGFAGDLLAIDNQRTGLLPPISKDQCKDDGWQLFSHEDGTPLFSNQGDCIQYVNTGQ